MVNSSEIIDLLCKCTFANKMAWSITENSVYTSKIDKATNIILTHIRDHSSGYDIINLSMEIRLYPVISENNIVPGQYSNVIRLFEYSKIKDDSSVKRISVEEEENKRKLLNMIDFIILQSNKSRTMFENTEKQKFLEKMKKMLDD